MNKLLACLFAGLMLAGSPLAVLAQEAVSIGGVQATRVVIAPPQTELSRIIKTGLSASYYGGSTDTQARTEARKLYFFYGARAFEPIWLSASADGHTQFSPAADKILAIFKDAEKEGFRPSDYLTPELDLSAAGTDPAKLAAVETAFSAATMRYAQHLFSGRIRPQAVSGQFDIKARRIDPSQMLVKLASSDRPDQVLGELEPKHREFVALKAALARFYDGAAQAQVTIPDGRVLKPGMKDNRVPLLRSRLDLPANVDGDLTYDVELVAAVMKFQDSMGLTADGVAGPATVAALNGRSATSKDDIVANMERWRWMPEDLGAFNVFVNLPEFRLAIMRNDEVAYTTRVVIGKPENQTPIFSDRIRHIVVNPYWNVPSSIAQNEIGPRLLSNPGYIANQNMELLYGSQVVNASMVDWSRTSIDNFKIRQRPGASNALGKVKFLFPNSHDVYLHDTPSKSLFERSMRAYSHGCVRVQNPMEFADALLQLEPSLTAAKLEGQYGPTESWNNLKTPVPVHLAYFTLRVDADGTIRSYGDVYGHNAALIKLLNK